MVLHTERVFYFSSFVNVTVLIFYIIRDPSTKYTTMDQLLNSFDLLRNYKGQEAVARIRNYEKSLLKTESIKNRMNFLHVCLQNQVIPNSFVHIKNADAKPFSALQSGL